MIMSQSADFRKLEQKAYLSYHQDGLIDLIIGSIVLCIAISEVMDSSIWNLIALLLILAYMPLKRRIAFPRLGYVKFNVKRGGVNMRLAGVVAIGVLVISLVGILVLLLSGKSLASPLMLAIRQSPLILYAVLGFIGFGLAGLVLRLLRLFLYALLSLAMMISGHLLHLTLWLPLLLLGGTILTIGAVLLIGFLRRYPFAKEGNYGHQ